MNITGWVVDTYGEIVKGTSSPTEEELLLDVGLGQALVLQTPSSMTARWDGAAWIDRPTSPGEHAQWDRALAVWVDPRTLDKVKADRIFTMKTARDAAVFGGMIWDGSGFDTDERSQSVLLGLYVDSQAPAFEPQPWRLSDNSWRVLDAAAAAGVWAALRAHVKLQFTKFATREYAIQQATTPAAVDAVSWEI